MTRLALGLIILLACAAPVAADTWNVDYISATNWSSQFYPSGAYFFLCCDSGGVLYGLTAEGGWKYLPGYYVYQQTPLVPSDIPQITLTSSAFNPGDGTFEAVAVNLSGVFGAGRAANVSCVAGCGGVVAVPELAIMRQLGLLGPKWGPKFSAIVNPPLARMTAFAAAILLGAPRHGDRIYLHSVVLEVQEWCSGLGVMKLLLGLGVFLILLGRIPWQWSLVLIAAVALIAVEVNVLRVVGIGVGVEWLGVASRGEIKEWAGWSAMALGVGQVLVCGWWTSRA